MLILTTLLFLALTVAWLCHRWVESVSAPFVFDDLEKLPARKVALVLGTSQKVAGGRTNLYFKYRIEAAAALWKSGKAKYLVVSGDNGSEYYNEPEDMAQALIGQGIPDSVIFRDFAGFRTLDSVVRCEAIFGQDSFTVVSQPFHNKRAIFIGRQKGLNVAGFNARDVPGNYGLKTRLREYLARVKVVLDLYLLGKEPRFYGERVEIP